jgi:hypothetical protein
MITKDAQAGYEPQLGDRDATAKFTVADHTVFAAGSGNWTLFASYSAELAGNWTSQTAQSRPQFRS